MPKPVQNSLIHVLLLWTTILSIIQVVIIILFFTNGHHAPSQHNNTVAPESRTHFQANQTPSQVRPQEGLSLGKGKMLTFKAKKGTEIINWVSSPPTDGPLKETSLVVTADGYYFLNLQVTLRSQSQSQSQCVQPNEIEVSLRLVHSDTVSCSGPEDKIILQGLINPNTRTTGVLSKVEVLSAGYKLCFDFDKNFIKCIDDNQSVTHLDVIYISKS